MKFLTNLPPTSYRAAQLGRVSLPLLVATVLGLALVIRVGLPLWKTFASQASGGTATVAVDSPSMHVLDLAGLQALDLFDSVSSTTTPAASLPAMNTALNLQLEGVILAGDGASSLAVIASGATRGSYRAGDSLPSGANIRVDSIARDHVVVDNRGQREVLWLFGGNNAAPVVNAGATGAAMGFALPAGTDARVLKTAARLAEMISVAPELKNGRLVGYRLTPGMRLKDFVQLGFQTNDIVTAVNGIALDNVANLPKLYSLMDGASEVSFSLLRDGAPLNLKVTLSPENSARQ